MIYGTTSELAGKSIINTDQLSINQIKDILKLAKIMKDTRSVRDWRDIFNNKTFLMMFFNKSLRTRLSFEVAVSELGGQPLYLSPDMCWMKTRHSIGESVEDIIKVAGRYVHGVGIRAAEGAVKKYGAGHELLLEYIKSTEKPIINMANDIYHPCQGLADIMGWMEYYGSPGSKIDIDSLRGKTLLVSWASSGSVRTWSSVHESILLASRIGMNVTIARPDGYDLDKKIYGAVDLNCKENNTSFITTNDSSLGYSGANIVYSRNWMSEEAYNEDGLDIETEVRRAKELSDWIATEEKMKATDNGIFTHCMPIYRGEEVVDEVASGNNSVIYEVAENRLHIQKALIGLTMGDSLGSIVSKVYDSIKGRYNA